MCDSPSALRIFPLSLNISNHTLVCTEMCLHTQHKHTHTHFDKSIHNSQHPDPPTLIVYRISHEDVRILTCLPQLPLKKPV